MCWSLVIAWRLPLTARLPHASVCNRHYTPNALSQQFHSSKYHICWCVCVWGGNPVSWHRRILKILKCHDPVWRSGLFTSILLLTEWSRLQGKVPPGTGPCSTDSHTTLTWPSTSSSPLPPVWAAWWLSPFWLSMSGSGATGGRVTASIIVSSLYYLQLIPVFLWTV